MANKNKFIYCKTKANFNSYLQEHKEELYNCTTFIQDSKEIYTHGNFYKASNRWAISSLTGSSDYATLAYNNGKVGDIFDMPSGTTVHGILGTINDKIWYIFYKDSIREYIYSTDTKKFTAGAIINLANDSEIPDPATVAPKMDGTAAVGSSNKYAREDHVHPSDNTKQDTLISGESIRTINNLSLLGEGNINVGDVPSITVENNKTPNETDFNRVVEAAANDRAVLIRIKTAEMTLTSNYWQYTSSESQRGFVAYATYLSGANNITIMAYIIENQPVVVETDNEELQEELVSGTNIKTINGESILGSGNIDTPDSKVTSAANHYTPVGWSATSGTIINSITKDEKGHIVDIGVANGIDAGKITSGVIDIERLPKGALERLVIVANKAARLALTTKQVQEGDTVKEKDTGHMYFVIDSSKLNSEDGYSIYTVGAASSVPWSGVTGKPDLVNSVKLVLPSSIFINSGSTLTGNAELGSSLSTQNANTVWAAPSGTSGVPTFRKLTFLDMTTVTSDEFNYIPQTFKGGRLVINYKNSAGGQNTDNTITEYQFRDGASNLTYIIAKGFKTSENHGHRVLCSNGSSKLLYGPSTPGTAGQVLISNGGSAPEWASLDSLGYLPLTGGTISGSLSISGHINPVNNGVSNIGERGKKFKDIYATTLHGNFSESTTFAAPHPNPIYIDNTNNSTDGVYLVLKNKGIYVSSFGTTNETSNYIETFMLHRKSDQSNSYKLSIRDDGNAYIRGKIIATQEWVTNNISGLSTNISSQGSVITSLGQYLITGADANATTTTSTVKIKLKQIGRSTATSASAFGSPSLESSGVTIPAATTTTAGVMTATDKSNLNTAYGWGNHASAGYLKSIPEATSSSYGGIKVGYSATGKNYAVQLDGNGKAYVNVPWEKGTGTITQINAGLGMQPKLITGSGTLDLSLRSSTQMSLSSQNASTVSGKVYAVQLDKDGYLGVSVPWTDTNTNYYPTTFTWTNGTSKGPTGSLTGTGMSAVSFGSIPVASSSNSGVITTEAQEISGEKYFNNGVFVGLSGSVSRGIIDGQDFGYDGLAIVSDSNVYIAPDNNIVYFGYDEDTYIQDGVFSGTASKANMVTGALTIHSGSTNITYNGSKTEEITIPRNRQTNLTRQAYGSDSSISVKKGICYYHNTGSLWATSINLSLNTADWSSAESINDTEIIETSMVVVESAYPVTFSSNSMLKVQKDIPLNGDAGTYRVYVFSKITPTLVAVNCAVYKAS